MNIGVHLAHCCVNSCKYLDFDCPVLTGKSLPKYRCENCTCIQMNPDALEKAKVWWEEQSDETKVRLYLESLAFESQFL